MKNLAKTLEDIISHGLNNVPLPYKKGKSIRIGSIAIRHSEKQGYIIFDCSAKKQLDVTFSRAAALAFAKHHDNLAKRSRILDLDAKFQKHFIDSMFFKNTIEKTDNDAKKTVAEARLDISQAHLKAAQHGLECIIFES